MSLLKEGKTHDNIDLPYNYTSYSTSRLDSFFCAPVGIFYKDDPERIIDNPYMKTNSQESKIVRKFLREYTLNSKDYVAIQNFSKLQILPKISEWFGCPIITWTYHMEFSDRWLIEFTKGHYLGKLSENIYPTNIGLANVHKFLYNVEPDTSNKEWWHDQSHPNTRMEVYI